MMGYIYVSVEKKEVQQYRVHGILYVVGAGALRLKD